VTVPYEPDDIEQEGSDARELPDEDREDALSPAGESDELTRRLRNLEWPEVSSEVRERCWDELTKRVPELDGEDDPHRDSGQTGESDPFRRHEFTPRLMPVSGGGALRERVAATRGLSRPAEGHRRTHSSSRAAR
jgi:hypothetical protein